MERKNQSIHNTSLLRKHVMRRQSLYSSYSGYYYHMWLCLPYYIIEGRIIALYFYDSMIPLNYSLTILDGKNIKHQRFYLSQPQAHFMTLHTTSYVIDCVPHNLTKVGDSPVTWIVFHSIKFDTLCVFITVCLPDIVFIKTVPSLLLNNNWMEY